MLPITSTEYMPPLCPCADDDDAGSLALEQEASRARLRDVEDQQQRRRSDLGGYILSLKVQARFFKMS